MARCFLCNPPSDMADEAIYEHMLNEHDFDIAKEVQKWPDGEWVIINEDPSPKDFE